MASAFFNLGSILGGLFLGAVLLTMNLGHWYLVSRSLPFRLLARGALLFAVLAAARTLLLGAAMLLHAGDGLSARAFAEGQLAPHSAEWDEKKHFPTDVLRQAIASSQPAATQWPCTAAMVGTAVVQVSTAGTSSERLDAQTALRLSLVSGHR